MLTRKPRVGDRIRFPVERHRPALYGRVVEVKDSGVVRFHEEPTGNENCFIGWFGGVHSRPIEFNQLVDEEAEAAS